MPMWWSASKRIKKITFSLLHALNLLYISFLLNHWLYCRFVEKLLPKVEKKQLSDSFQIEKSVKKLKKNLKKNQSLPGIWKEKCVCVCVGVGCKSVLNSYALIYVEMYLSTWQCPIIYTALNFLCPFYISDIHVCKTWIKYVFCMYSYTSIVIDHFVWMAS